MTDTSYNGWANFETWKVNVEFFDGGDWKGWSAEAMRDTVDNMIDDADVAFPHVVSWARAFLDAVDWNEIADVYNEEV